MVVQGDMSIRDEGNLLGIEPVLVARLCRYLRIDPRDQRIPPDVLQRLAAYGVPDERYAALRSWVLGTLPSS